MPVRLAYACINTELKEKKIFTNRTLTLETLKNKGIELAIERANQNISDLLQILKYNEDHGLRFFRISSNVIPRATDPYVLSKYPQYNVKMFANQLEKVGLYARQHGHRLTFHPGQFVQLGSTNSDVVRKSIIDLKYHADLLLSMGMTPELGSVMIIHMGGHYGDKLSAIKRFISTFRMIPVEISKYISLENDEIYSISDVLPVCEELNIPCTPDYFHDTINNIDHLTGNKKNIYDLTDRIVHTWRKRGIKPKCHLSGQMKNARRGAHSKCITSIPTELLAIARQYDIDIMLETKDKEQCVFQMLNKYFIQTQYNRLEWALK